jgi:hypothetical protein
MRLRSLGPIAVLGLRALVTGWYDDHVYLVGFEGTRGDPASARAKIEGWIRRPRHP